MSSTLSKQDRQPARSAADLERRHAFGKSFSEVAGIATDARTRAEGAQKQAEDATVENAADVVRMINFSEEVIELKNNRLIINSDKLTLTKEGDLETVGAKIGNWDISEDGISKITDTFYVNIASPDSLNSDFITVSELLGGELLSVPLSIRTNGDIFTKGSINCSNADGTALTTIQPGVFKSTNTVQDTSTTIEGGVITVDGRWYVQEDTEKNLILRFMSASGDLCGLYVYGHLDENLMFVPEGITVERITE